MTEPINTATSSPTTEASPTKVNARKRISLSTRNVLTAPKKSGVVRRFVNDNPDRIQAFLDAGYNVVKDDTLPVGDAKIGKVTHTGTVVNPSVGGGQRAVLMEIPEEFYKQDQKAKQDEIKKTESEMKRDKNSVRSDGLSGQVTIS